MPNESLGFEFNNKRAEERTYPLYKHFEKINAQRAWKIDYTEYKDFSVRVEMWFTQNNTYIVRIHRDGHVYVFGNLDVSEEWDKLLEKIT